MPRPLWTGSISFGLVNVPIKLFKAQSPKDVRFHQLHGKDGVRIQQKRICPADNEEVAYDDIVKGYEIDPGHYVTITQDELSSLDAKATHTIDIEDFVDLDEIDPLYFDNGYYIVPDARAEKSYKLLLAAMNKTRKVGVARFVMRTKEYLCAVRPIEGALVLSTMYYNDEIVSLDEMRIDDDVEAPKKKELDMAVSLIESLTSEFKPEQYKDEYREKVIAMVESKAEGNEIVSGTPEEEPAPVVDLMAALEASLAAAKERKASSKESAPVTPAEAGAASKKSKSA